MTKGSKKGSGANSDELAENCLAEVLIKNEAKMRKEFGDDFFDNDEDAGNELGMEIVKVLAKDC